MKKAMLTGLLIFAAGAASALVAVPPEPEASDTGTSEGALILLAMVGMVIASSQIGGLVGRNSNKMDIDPDEVDDDAGF